jgi:cyanate permease
MNARLLAGALLLSLAFGSLHAFGVLLEPLQEQFHAGRAGISLAYSLAIAALTLGVFASPRLAAWSAAQRALLFGLLGAGGLALAASDFGLGGLLLGYGLVFGLGNGLAYALFIDCAGAALPRRRGVAIGAATAAYGLGAVLSARILAPIAAGAPLTALWLMAAAMGLAGLGAGALFAGSSRSTPPPDATLGGPARSGLFGLWLVYFLGAFGGLMVIAHAMAILTARGASPEFAALAPALNAAGNVAGSILGGLHADRAAPGRALAWPLVATAAALATLLILPSGGAALLLIALCGGGYGALIAAVPVVVRRAHGADYAPAFGRVFTAWGFAGLLGPLAAGALFDWRQGYDLAIAAALACALAALWVIRVAARPAAHATQP